MITLLFAEWSVRLRSTESLILRLYVWHCRKCKWGNLSRTSSQSPIISRRWRHRVNLSSRAPASARLADTPVHVGDTDRRRPPCARFRAAGSRLPGLLRRPAGARLRRRRRSNRHGGTTGRGDLVTWNAVDFCVTVCQWTDARMTYRSCFSRPIECWIQTNSRGSAIGHTSHYVHCSISTLFLLSKLNMHIFSRSNGCGWLPSPLLSGSATGSGNVILLYHRRSDSYDWSAIHCIF